MKRTTEAAGISSSMASDFLDSSTLHESIGGSGQQGNRHESSLAPNFLNSILTKTKREEMLGHSTPPTPLSTLEGAKSTLLKTEAQTTLYFQMPSWLRRAYASLLAHSTLPTLSISLLSFRFIDPESPLWFTELRASVDDSHDFHLHLLQELLPFCTSHKDQSPSNHTSHLHTTLYLKHNIAVLLFLVGRSTEALSLMDHLVEHCSQNPSLQNQRHFILQSTVFIYIHLGMFYEASVLLIHLLHQVAAASQLALQSSSPRHVHSIYLSLRLLDQYLNCIYLPDLGVNDDLMSQSTSKDAEQQSMFFIPNVTLPHLLTFRESSMHFVCKNKPKNHLYKLWLSQWVKQRMSILRELSIQTTNEVSILAIDDLSESRERLVDNLVDFLVQISKLYAPQRMQLGTDVEKDSPPNGSTLLKQTIHAIARPNTFSGKVVHWFQGVFLNPKWSMFVGVVSILSAVMGFSFVVRALRAWMYSTRRFDHASMAPRVMREVAPVGGSSVFDAPSEVRYGLRASHLPRSKSLGNESISKGYTPAYTAEDEQELKRGMDGVRVFMEGSASGVNAPELSSVRKDVDFEYASQLFKSIGSHLADNERHSYKQQQTRAEVIQHWLEEYEKKKNDKNTSDAPRKALKSTKRIQILYSSQRGTSKAYATKLYQQLKKVAKSISLSNMNKFDPELITQAADTDILILFAPTYDDGLPCDDGRAFYEWLVDLSLDFRVNRNMLQHINFAIMGLGDSAFGAERFCAVAKKMERCLRKLSAQPLVPSELGDNGAGNDVNTQFNTFRENVLSALTSSTTTSTTPITTQQTDVSKSVEIHSDSDDDSGEPMLDIEDMGVNDDEHDTSDTASTNTTSDAALPEMLTPLLRKSLEKQGYKLFGSHSGVKLCRWTKAMLRGRGGCYKHTAYGITSYQCMEMTPSLACASKCVFCWRHHSNPVARSWKWKVDEPEFLIKNAIENHVKMINSMRGVPGVQKERFEAAFVPKHCALSLVGEPIIYPHIGKFLNLLHEKEISSFLVTNAQFPEQMENVDKVTQLYISVDASNPESLKKIDRPIFEDYWERFLQCIDIMKRKRMRTVFRLTLVKSWNMNEMREYAELIQRGEPMFIEIKGVTYCGNSKSSDLTMQNVPFHEEVKDFAFKLCEVEGMEDYEPACIHEHSCFVLIAHKKFKIAGEWHTWIDYERFHELVRSGVDFGAEDYLAKTPDWALIDSLEQGFDPKEERVFRRGAKKAVKEEPAAAQEYSAGGC